MHITITTHNIVFAIFWASAEYWMPIFFLLKNHLKWWYKNESQTKIDPNGKFCNLGNQTGGPSHGMQPHTSKHYCFLGTLMTKRSRPWKSWHRANIEYKHFIPKAQTHWYTLWEDNICLDHGLVHYFEHGTHITTYNLVFAIFIASAESCVPIFFLLMNHLKWWYKNESQT